MFREFLRREATQGDIDAWMETGSLRTFIDGVAASAEYAERLDARQRREEARSRGFYLNCWLEDWSQFARPVGEISSDEVAIVGESGHLFIYRGSNENVATFRGQASLPTGWLEGWSSLIGERLDAARGGGWLLVNVVVPEKLAVYSDRYPHDLAPVQPRPVIRLLNEASLPLVYPLDELRQARETGDTYLRTDTHLTPYGNRILAEATLRALDVPLSAIPGWQESENSYLSAGDLGRHFDPFLLEVMKSLGWESRANITSDNRAEVARAGGHIGTIRSFRREDSPDERIAVIFGDSYGFGDESYAGLSWWLAQVFREVHFVWAPFGWDSAYLQDVKAEVIVCQTAERFMGRVPKLSIDARQLATEASARQQALPQTSIFR